MKYRYSADIKIAPKDDPANFVQEIRIHCFGFDELTNQALGVLWAAHQKGNFASVWFPHGIEAWTTAGLSGRPPERLAQYIEQGSLRIGKAPAVDEIITAGLNHIYDVLMVEHGYLDQQKLLDAVLPAVEEWVMECYQDHEPWE